MRTTLLAFLILLSVSVSSQEFDSAFVKANILSRFSKDTVSVLAKYHFTDEKGNKVLLSDLTGKIIYLDIWSTYCAPCMAKFPYEEQLLKRLKVLHLDTSIVFVNINIESSKRQWKKALNRLQPVGINLHTSDTTLYENWGIPTLPCYILLNSSGRVLGKNIIRPDDAGIDWLLYCTTKGISPEEATWREFTQIKLMEKQRTSNAINDAEYSAWFKNMLPAFLEFNNWRQMHMKATGRL